MILICSADFFVKWCNSKIWTVGVTPRSNRIKVKANPAAQDLDTTNIDILIRECEYLKAQQIYFNEADSLITETIAAEEVDPNSARFVINDSTIVLPESLEDG